VYAILINGEGLFYYYFSARIGSRFARLRAPRRHLRTQKEAEQPSNIIDGRRS
jgi:hypothetical protein